MNRITAGVALLALAFGCAQPQSAPIERSDPRISADDPNLVSSSELCVMTLTDHGTAETLDSCLDNWFRMFQADDFMRRITMQSMNKCLVDGHAPGSKALIRCIRARTAALGQNRIDQIDLERHLIWLEP